MAKISGLAWSTLQVDDASSALQDLRNDITDFQFATPRAVQDVTGIDKSAIERLLLLADFTISMNGVFNNAANHAHAVFKTIPSTSVNRRINNTISGSNLNITGVVLTDYQLKRAATGQLTWTVPGSNADGSTPVWT